MIGLKKRIELIERSEAKAGRLLVVVASSAANVDAQCALAGIDRRPSDTIVRIHGVGHHGPPIAVHEQGLEHLLRSIDGRSRPLVRGAR